MCPIRPWIFDKFVIGGGGLRDAIAPTLSTIEVGAVADDKIVLTYDELLDTTSVPATGDFSLSGTSKTVSSVGVNGSAVTLTLSENIYFTDTVLLSYTAGSNPIRDLALNNASNLTNQAVTNNSSSSPLELALAFTSTQFEFKFKAPSTSTLTMNYSDGTTSDVAGNDSTLVTHTSTLSGAGTYTFWVTGDLLDITYIGSRTNGDQRFVSGDIESWAELTDVDTIIAPYWTLTGDIATLSDLPLTIFQLYQCTSLTGDVYAFRESTILHNLSLGSGGNFEYSGTGAWARSSGLNFSMNTSGFTSTDINNILISFDAGTFSGKNILIGGDNSIRTSVSDAAFAAVDAANNLTVNEAAANSIGVIFDGQSNSSGQGAITSLDAYLTGALTGCYMWKDGDWQVLEAGVNQDGYSDCIDSHHGSELECAYRLREEYSTRDIYIVKTGFGGTVLAQVASNDHNHASTGEYHDYILARVAEAGATNITWEAYIWSQGETDATNTTYASAYETNLTNKIADLRTELSIAALPVIINRIHTSLVADYKATVRTAQDNVATADSDVYLNSTDSLSLKGDGIHLDSAGLVDRGNAEFVIIRDSIFVTTTSTTSTTTTA